VKSLRAIRDDLGLEVTDKDLLGKDEVAEDGGVVVPQDGLVDVDEIAVAPLDHRRVWILARGAPDHHRIALIKAGNKVNNG